MFCLSTRELNSRVEFDLSTYRMTRVKNVITNSNDIKRELQRIVDSSGGRKSYAEQELNLINFVISHWQFDVLTTDTKLEGIVKSKIAMALTIGSERVRDDSPLEEGQSIDTVVQRVNNKKTKYQIETNYKFLLKGVKALIDTLEKNTTGKGIRLMYTLLLHISNDKSISNFIEPFPNNISCDYKNTRGPNKIIELYTTNSQQNEDREVYVVLQDTLNAYILSNKGNKCGIHDFEDFARDLHVLFTEVLGLNILNKRHHYNVTIVNDEMRELISKVPDSKFSIEFIDSTKTVSEWIKIDPSKIKNEFGIQEYKIPTIESMVTNSLIPAQRRNNVKLNIEKERLEFARLMSISKQGKEGKLYKEIYLKGISNLETQGEKQYLLVKDIKASEAYNIPVALQEVAGRRKIMVGKSLELEMENLKGKLGEELLAVEPEVLNYLSTQIKFQIDDVSRKIHDNLRVNHYSQTSLREHNSLEKLRQEINSTIKYKHDVLTLLNTEINVELRLDFDTNKTTYKVLTKQGYIVTESHIIIPEFRDKKDKSKGLKPRHSYPRETLRG